MERYRNTRTGWRYLDADYVYYGPLEKQISKIDLSQETKLKRIYHDESVEIYEIVKDSSG